METRTVKFNIKEFIQDFSYAEDSKDYDEALELLSKFDAFYYSSSGSLKEATINYLIKSRVAMQYPVIQDITRRLHKKF